MKISVIIPTLEKNKEYLRLCVESLRKTVDWDIVVVSNGGNSYPLTDIRSITQRMHTTTQGQCNAVNVGVQGSAVDSTYLFIVNDDMYFAPDWNKNLKFAYPVFSPNLVEPANNAGSAPPFLKLDAGFNLDEFKQDEVDKFVKGFEIAEGEPHAQTGFNFPVFIHRNVWDVVGGYDESYDPWGSNSDSDLQTKIEIAGIKPMRLLDVLVYHFSNKSGTFDGTHQMEWQRNFDYYTDKFGFERVDSPDIWYSNNIIDKEKLHYHPVWEGKYQEGEK